MIEDKEYFGMCYELVDIDSVEDSGYKNVQDITVSGNNSFVLGNGLVSHNSAFGGLSPVLGRKDCGYYILKGKPLNSYRAKHSDFVKNKELTELFSIIRSECKFADKPNGDYYEIDVDGVPTIINENDLIEVNDQWITFDQMVGDL